MLIIVSVATRWKKVGKFWVCGLVEVPGAFQNEDPLSCHHEVEQSEGNRIKHLAEIGWHQWVDEDPHHLAKHLKVEDVSPFYSTYANITTVMVTQMGSPDGEGIVLAEFPHTFVAASGGKWRWEIQGLPVSGVGSGPIVAHEQCELALDAFLHQDENFQRMPIIQEKEYETGTVIYMPEDDFSGDGVPYTIKFPLLLESE